MIKNILELNSNERISALEFIKNAETIDLSLSEIEKELKCKICNYGEGVLFYFHKDKIANKYKANKVLLGIRDKDLLNLAQEIGLERSYSSFNMILNNREKENDVLDKIKLSNKNIKEYVDVYNKSFMDMPHGTYIEIEDVEGYLENKSLNEDYFIIIDKGESIGFLNSSIEDNKGFFDIGLIKEYRGKGYGKKILETAIQYLNEKQVEEICLTVIEKNKIAYEMYKKRGFKVYNKLSDWIEIK